MNNDHDQEFEEVAKRWPDLIQKSQQDYIGVGKGWHHILDALFALLSRDVEQAKYNLKYAMENPESKFTKPISELEATLAKAQEELPVILQIKEKFGGLRVYINGGNESHHNYISFAGSMASRTCEECGSPGEIRNEGWMKTLCNKHHKEREEKVIASNNFVSRFKEVKLSDE